MIPFLLQTKPITAATRATVIVIVHSYHLQILDGLEDERRCNYIAMILVGRLEPEGYAAAAIPLIEFFFIADYMSCLV